MGLSEGAVKLYLELWQRGYLANMESVCEMGSQELHLTQGSLEGLIRTAGISEYDREAFSNLGHFPHYPRCSARALYELLGAKDYKCIDLNGMYDAIPHDLNLPFTDASLFGKFDMVTDHGNNEHAFNIAETYRTMHNLCKPGGSIVINQNIYGGNGYYNFDLSFFEGLAAANDYSILFASFVVSLKRKYRNRGLDDGSEVIGDTDEFHIPLSRELLDSFEWSKDNAWLGISYVFKKNSDREFQYAYQSEFLAEAQGHYGYQLQFLPTLPGRTYLPLRANSPGSVQEGVLRSVRIKVLAKHLIKRIVGRVLRFTRIS